MLWNYFVGNKSFKKNKPRSKTHATDIRRRTEYEFRSLPECRGNLRIIWVAILEQLLDFARGQLVHQIVNVWCQSNRVGQSNNIQGCIKLPLTWFPSHRPFFQFSFNFPFLSLLPSFSPMPFIQWKDQIQSRTWHSWLGYIYIKKPTQKVKKRRKNWCKTIQKSASKLNRFAYIYIIWVMRYASIFLLQTASNTLPQANICQSVP